MQQQPQNQSTSRSTTAVVSSPVAISQSQPHKLASMTPREWAGHPPKLPAVKCGSAIEVIPAPRNRCRQLGRRRLGFADGQLTLCTTSKLFPRENGDLLGACKFLLHLLRVDEFVATRFTGVEPGHDCFRLRGPTLRETEHGVVSWLRTLCINCEEHRNQHSAIGVEDTDLKMIVNLIRQHEHVRSRRQHASGNLNGLAEGDSGFLIRLVCMCSGRNDQARKHKQDGDKTRYDSGSLHNSSFFSIAA